MHGGWLEGRGRQRTAQIGFVHQDHPQPGMCPVPAQPAERQLVRHGQNDQDVGDRMPVTGELRVADGEIESRVRRLASLRPWCQIGTGNQIQPVRAMTLAVRHRGQPTRL